MNALSSSRDRNDAEALKVLAEMSKDIYEAVYVHNVSVDVLSRSLMLSIVNVRMLLESEEKRRNGTVTQHTETMRDNRQSDNDITNVI